MSTKNARKKRPLFEDLTSDQAGTVLTEYANADAKKRELEAKMDQKINQIREKFQPELNTLDEKMELAFDKLQHFATSNRDKFAKKKSLDMATGTIGFRTGTPKLKTLKGFTWASVTKLLEEFLKDYTKKTVVPDKEALLKNRDNEEVSKLFPKVGIEVVQDETFFVEPKREEVEA